MLTSFNALNTPLMKLLTGLDLLLNKLEEWEKTYASKRLNSVETNIVALKQLVIRYRKIQILSWRNLLNWRKQKMITEDMMGYVRLCHAVERQIFDD
jgi:midasin (ATPase involved in ribosome maturation)